MSESTTEIDRAEVGAPIPRSVFDSSRLTLGNAFESWREHLEPICEPRLAGSDSGHFHARVDSIVLDKIVLGEMRITPPGLRPIPLLHRPPRRRPLCAALLQEGSPDLPQ